MTTCDLRLKAAAVIEERGWCQREFTNKTGACCLISSLMEANPPPDDGDDRDMFARVDLRIQAVDDMRLGSQIDAIHWNDAPGRTAAEVIARLRDGCAEPAA